METFVPSAECKRHSLKVNILIVLIIDEAIELPHHWVSLTSTIQ